MAELNRRQLRFIEEVAAGKTGKEAAIIAGYSPKAADVTASRMLAVVKVRQALDAKLAQLSEQAGVKASEIIERWKRRATFNAQDFISYRTKYLTRDKEVSLTEAARLKSEEADLEQEILDTLPKGAGKDERGTLRYAITKLRKEAHRLAVAGRRHPERTMLVSGALESVQVAYVDLAKLREAGRLDMVKGLTEMKDGSVKVELHDAAQADDALARHLGMFVDRHMDVGEVPEAEVLIVDAEPGAPVPPAALTH